MSDSVGMEESPRGGHLRLELGNEFGCQLLQTLVVRHLGEAHVFLPEPIGVIREVLLHRDHPPWFLGDESLALVLLLGELRHVIAQRDLVGLLPVRLTSRAIAQILDPRPDLRVVVFHGMAHLLRRVAKRARPGLLLLVLRRQRLTRGIRPSRGKRPGGGVLGDDLRQSLPKERVLLQELRERDVHRGAMRLEDGSVVAHRLVDDLQNLTLGVLVVIEVRESAVPVQLSVVLVFPHLPRTRHAALSRGDGALGREQRVRVVRVRGDEIWLAERVVHHDVSYQIVRVSRIRRAVARDVVVEKHLLRRATGEQHLHAFQQTSARGEKIILVAFAVVRRLRGIATARDDADALDGLDESVGLVQHSRHERVSKLVSGHAVHHVVILVGDGVAQTVGDAIGRFHHVGSLDPVRAATHRHRRRLVADVGELGAGQPGRFFASCRVSMSGSTLRFAR